MKTGLLSLLCLAGALFASTARADTLLFDSHSILELSIPLNFKALCRPRETPDCDFAPTTLDYIDEHGQAQSIKIEVIIRGGWRSLTENCSAPLLFIRFNEDDSSGTPFEGQTMLPLTTHCGRGMSLHSASLTQRGSDWEQYLLREYLAHRLYNVISDVSVKARLVQMTYPNPEKPKNSIRNYAFFTEHFESVASRSGAVKLPRHNFDHERLDGQASNELALFEFMIGNTDWSIVRERNIVILQRPDDVQIPLPYDFDMSGLVNAKYAGPAPTLPIDTVQDRYFLGYCHPDTDWDLLFKLYLGKQEKLLSMTGEIQGLDRNSRRFISRFLREFFTIIGTPDERDEKIVNHCQAWPPDPEDHMRPFDK